MEADSLVEGVENLCGVDNQFIATFEEPGGTEEPTLPSTNRRIRAPQRKSASTGKVQSRRLRQWGLSAAGAGARDTFSSWIGRACPRANPARYSCSRGR